MMQFRLATADDSPQLRVVFAKIIEKMNQANGPIWDDFYPCEVFPSDIAKKQLYILTDNDTIVSAFALWHSDALKESVQWENPDAKAMYFGRFGVNVDYRRKGIGSFMLGKAMEIAREQGDEYLRIFVVDRNAPALKTYEKNGFKQAGGMYVEKIDDSLTLNQYGVELKL